MDHSAVTSPPIRWGILGTGNIARQFATGLNSAPGAELAAVGSRAAETAESFGEQFDIPRRYATYEDFTCDPELDVVYVATPHPMHRDNSILCLEAGKAVLCEKSFTVNAAMADDVIAVARERGLFLMEAMWTRFLPAVVKVRQWLREGAIGDVRMVQADFGFRSGLNPEGRLFDPELGGGALLDVGIYAISFASMVLGPHPEAVESTAEIGTTGVDEQSAFLLRYGGGEIAVLSCGVRTSIPVEARIIGTEGRILLHAPFYRGTTVTLTSGENETQLDFPLEGNGYNYQAMAVGECLRAGKLESETMPLDETRAIVALMDRIRAQWGLKYPME